jgi:hypothetical protein
VEKKMADLPKNREELQAATKGKPDADILAMAKGNEENVIDMILNAMPARFDAAKAGNQSAVFQFDVDTPAGLKTNQVAVEAGKVSIVKGHAQVRPTGLYPHDVWRVGRPEGFHVWTAESKRRRDVLSECRDLV